MDRLRRVFKNSFSSASKQNASANAKSTAKKNLKHTKSMPIRRSLEYEYPPDPPPPPRNILHSTKAYSSRFRTHNKPAPSRQVPRNVNAELQEEEDYGNVLDIHSGVTVITREDLEAFPMPPNTLLFPANPSKILAFHDQRNEEQRTAAETRKRRRAGYNLTMHGNASTPTVYHHGSMRQKHVHPSTANTNTGSHRGRSRFDKPLPPSPGDRLEYTSPASTSSSHSNDQNSSSRHRQGSTTPHRSRSRAAPSSHHRVLEERSQYMTEQGMTTYPGIKNVAAVRQGHPVFQVGESDHRQSHRVEILFAPGDEPVPVHSVSQITRQVDDYLVSQNLARNYGEAF